MDGEMFVIFKVCEIYTSVLAVVNPFTTIRHYTDIRFFLHNLSHIRKVPASHLS